MSRELKFNFIYGIDGEIETYFNKTFTFGEIEGGCHFEEISDSPMLKKYSILGKRQYTGLKDKNGIEIYEGDILKIDGILEDDLITTVEWNTGSFLANKGQLVRNLAHWAMEGTEIIGNIHQHPELLNPTPQGKEI